MNMRIVGGALSVLVGFGAIGMGVIALVPHRTVARLFGYESAMVAPMLEVHGVTMTGLFEETKHGGKNTWPAGKVELMDALWAIPHWIRRRPYPLALATVMREFTEETGLPIHAEQLHFRRNIGEGKTDTGFPVVLFSMNGCAAPLPGAELTRLTWYTEGDVEGLLRLGGVRKFVREPLQTPGMIFPVKQ